MYCIFRLGEVNPELRSKSNHAFAKKITNPPKRVGDAMEKVAISPPSPETPNVQNGESLQTKKLKSPSTLLI